MFNMIKTFAKRRRARPVRYIVWWFAWWPSDRYVWMSVRVYAWNIGQVFRVKSKKKIKKEFISVYIRNLK